MITSSEIIECFSTESDGSGAAECIRRLDEADQKKLFSKVDELVSSAQFATFIRAILNGSSLPSSAASKRRRLCFDSAIGVIKGGKVNPQQIREIVEVLNHHARLLSADQALALCDRIIDEAPGIPASGGLDRFLELLPQLVARSDECREHVIEKLYNLTWPVGLVVTFSSSLVEICATESECERAMGKIAVFLREGSQPPRHGGSATRVEPEDLPQLVYHLTTLSKRADGSNHGQLKKSLLYLLSDVMDGIIRVMSSNHPGLSAETLDGRFDRHIKRLQPAVATITHYLTTLVTKDQV
jgi:hypothetical protein